MHRFGSLIASAVPRLPRQAPVQASACGIALAVVRAAVPPARPRPGVSLVRPYFQLIAAILRRMKAIWVASGSCLGQTS